MIWTVIQLLISALALWIVVNWIISRVRIRRYSKMLNTISSEEVHALAETFTWKPGDPKEPPTLQAWEQIFNQRRKQWGYPTKEE